MLLEDKITYTLIITAKYLKKYDIKKFYVDV